MTNLTLSVDADVLRRARVRAVQEDTSVNAEVRAFLNGYADGSQQDQRKQAMSRLVALAQSMRTGGGLSERAWDRDDLHER
ncbi:MAG: hypothetical protein FWD75_04830 [Propionibacteriaceae bacterium]|nr:hypothetical protein [Propionibacteriaceae bacterium]